MPCLGVACSRPGESLITPEGIWIGRHWLRVSRDRDSHAGVLEREQQMRRLREDVETARAASEQLAQALHAARRQAAELEETRESVRISMGHAQREHADLRAPNSKRGARVLNATASASRSLPRSP